MSLTFCSFELKSMMNLTFYHIHTYKNMHHVYDVAKWEKKLHFAYKMQHTNLLAENP